MAIPAARRLQDQACAALRGNLVQEGLLVAEEAVKVAPDDPRGLRLLAIAQGQMGRKEDALSNLARAVELDPSDAVAWYNLSLAQDRAGVPASASSLERALAIRPGYPEALARQAGGSGRWDPGEVHTIRWIDDAGKAWTQAGWALAGLAAVVMVGRWIHPPAVWSAVGQAQGLADAVRLNDDPASMVLVFFSIVTGVGSAAWVLLDMIDRRSRAIWVVPMVVFGVCGCLVAIPHALYMTIGRR